MPNPNKIKQFMNGSPTLTEGLVAYWPLDEASGTRAAFWGEDDLSPTSAPGRAAGKFGYAADFDGVDDYLNIADNIRLSAGDVALTICGWVNADTLGSDRGIISKWGSANEYELFYDNTAARFKFQVRNTADTATTTATADALGAPATGTWYFIVCWHDPDADEIAIQVNDLQPNTTATTGGVRDSTAAFRIGARSNTTADLFFDGKIQHVGIWKRVLTAEERRDLYLGSAAEAFSPDTGSSLTTRLVSFWKLDEAAGTRRDSYGGNNLTDNNTVTSAAGKVGIAASFDDATSEYLSLADNASLSTGDIDFSISCWVYLSSKPANWMGIVTKHDSGTVREYALFWRNATDDFTFQVFNSSGTAVGTAIATNFGAPALNTWYFITCYHDATNNEVGISVNNGTFNTAATTGTPGDSAAGFKIGAFNATPDSFWDGRIDEVGFWKKKLSAQEITDLYNSGNGNTYPQAGNGQAMEEVDFAADYPDLLPHGGRGIQTFEKIAETSLTADAANIDFTSISGKYRHLLLQTSLRATQATALDTIKLQFNGDTAANYDAAYYRVDDAATTTGSGNDGPAVSALVPGIYPGSSAPANVFNPTTIWIPDYVNRARHKSAVATGGIVEGTAAGNIETGEGAGRWRDTSAITRVTLAPQSGNWVSGSRATLYGIRTHKFLVDQNDTLVEDLVAYWNLDETSGTRVDSWGANHLTDNNTVTSQPGRYGIAAEFASANDEFLSISDNAAVSIGDIDYTFAFWVYPTTTDHNPILAKGASSSTKEFKIRVQSNVAFEIFDGTNLIVNLNGGTIEANKWYFVVAWHDSTASVASFQINNGAIYSAPLTGAQFDSGDRLTIGRDDMNIGATEKMDGRIDEVGFWKKVLTAQERSDLWNNGYGNTLVKLGSK